MTTPNGTHKLPSDGRVRRDDEATSASPEGVVHGPGTPWRTDRPNEAFTAPVSRALGSDWRVQR
ncbi:hypothetical protein [Mycobacteroides abscessus]|uniref:hypothetical protein n=1 Tax=Mycobacteroides abscessus TaxID=36809 RepID=UPI00094C6C6C|nr:hypothetical protein [Mycobacteroides abscessus]